MVLILIFAEVLGLYGCVFAAIPLPRRVTQTFNPSDSLLH